MRRADDAGDVGVDAERGGRARAHGATWTRRILTFSKFLSRQIDLTVRDSSARDLNVRIQFGSLDSSALFADGNRRDAVDIYYFH